MKLKEKWFGTAFFVFIFLTLGAFVTGCGNEDPNDGTFSAATLTGQVFDGRTLEPRGDDGFVIGPPLPLTAHVQVLSGGGMTLSTLSAENDTNNGLLGETDTNDDGTFEIEFIPPTFPDSMVMVMASKEGFEPVTWAVQISGGLGSIDFYLSNTLLTGNLIGPDGKPAVTDIWVQRCEESCDDPANFTPYEITGGRDFNFNPSDQSTTTNPRFGVDTDIMGYFNIPIRIPDAEFNLVIAVDTNTNKFATLNILQEPDIGSIFVPADSIVDAGTYQLKAPASVVEPPDEEPPAPPPDEEVSFLTDIQPIFDANCIRCHSGATAPLGLDLSEGVSFGNLVNQPSLEFQSHMRVNPGDSRTPCETGLGSGDGSEIVEKISGCPDTPGVPSFGGLMPLGGPFLSAEEIDLIIEWIDAGAKNN
jgi:hypothetical protein